MIADTYWYILVLSYFMGSIPFGLLITRAFGLGDVRKVGSRNIGATNVARTGRKDLALLTLFFDGGKGFLAVWIALHSHGEELALLSSLAVVLGHVFPVWLKFKGGKGVATTFGVFFALNWMFALAICFIWLAAFYTMRYSSLAAIISIGYSSVIAYFLDNYLTALLCLVIAPLVLYTHRNNIRRLLNGTEPAFGTKPL